MWHVSIDTYQFLQMHHRKLWFLRGHILSFPNIFITFLQILLNLNCQSYLLPPFCSPDLLQSPKPLQGYTWSQLSLAGSHILLFPDSSLVSQASLIPPVFPITLTRTCMLWTLTISPLVTGLQSEKQLSSTTIWRKKSKGSCGGWHTNGSTSSED